MLELSILLSPFWCQGAKEQRNLSLELSHVRLTLKVYIAGFVIQL